MKPKVSDRITIILTTFNRREVLLETLETLKGVLPYNKILICDDASTDKTYETVSGAFSEVRWIINKSNKGLIASRNTLMKAVSTEYVISLDDDANFLNPDALEDAIDFMDLYQDCSILSFRLFWGLDLPKQIDTSESYYRVKNFLGGAHLMRLQSWKECIKAYPAWYTFYGEEDYASLKLFQRKWKIFYYPDVLIHHRVSVSLRKNQETDWDLRSRRSLHASWSNYLIFYPRELAYKKILYSIKEQLRIKFIKGDFKILKALFLAAFDLNRFSDKRKKLNTRLTKTEIRSYLKMREAPIYWRVEDE